MENKDDDTVEKTVKILSIARNSRGPEHVFPVNVTLWDARASYGRGEGGIRPALKQRFTSLWFGRSG